MKNSNIQWVGEIPDDWEVVRFKYLHNGLNTGESIDKQYWTSDTEKSFFYTAGIEPIHSTYSKFPKWKYTKANDILLARNGTPYVYFPYLNALYSDHIIRADIKGEFDKRFIRYSLQQSIASVVVDTVSIPTWSASLWNEQSIPLPPLATQTSIATYLDTKCSEIDGLIADINKQIETLNELKKSTITEAVTKGLNKNAKLKDSGIQWIGMIPEGWRVSRLKYLGQSQNGISKGGEFFGEGFPFVAYGDVYKNISIPNKVEGLIRSTQQEQINYSVKYGDIFFTRTSETIEEIGFSSVCLNTIDNAVFAGFLIRFRPTDLKTLSPNYSKYYFRSDIHRKYFVKEMNLVTRASLSQFLLGRLPVLLPPLAEQQSIATYLDTKCTEFDSIISDKQKQISTLEAYKKSLIYEYVTGKNVPPVIDN